MSAQMVILIFTLVIYILILMAFNRARKKYSGGKVGDVINLILVTVILLFIADYVLLLSPVISQNVLEIIGAFFRTAGLAFLAFGGIRVAS
ncbi:MAG: hypothetical protein U9O82_01635 [Thermodesulfobacteriota bacterium]|nr:hypothetical protein [Thermodesulfobacteriota bacterium]